MSERYKIVPGYYMRFRLLRWLGVPFLPFLGFWDCVSAEDDYSDLAERVRLVGGKLVATPPLTTEKAETK